MPDCILAVDDENTITIALELLLRDHGYEVSSAANAAEAEALLARRWFDLFLTPGIWQQRQRAKAIGDGIYEVTVNVPETGVYFVFVESPSQHVQYRQLQYLILQAKDKVAAN